MNKRINLKNCFETFCGDYRVKDGIKEMPAYIKIETELSNVQGRCHERTLDVRDILNVVKKFLNAISISPVSLDGTVLEYIEGTGHYANAYKYVPMGTAFDIKFENGNIYLVDIERRNCRRENSTSVKYSDTAAQKIIDHLSAFR